MIRLSVSLTFYSALLQLQHALRDLQQLVHFSTLTLKFIIYFFTQAGYLALKSDRRGNLNRNTQAHFFGIEIAKGFAPGSSTILFFNYISDAGVMIGKFGSAPNSNPSGSSTFDGISSASFAAFHRIRSVFEYVNNDGNQCFFFCIHGHLSLWSQECGLLLRVRTELISLVTFSGVPGYQFQPVGTANRDQLTGWCFFLNCLTVFVFNNNQNFIYPCLTQLVN